VIVICAGMYRSGSTWQYLVACHLLDKVPGGARLGYVGYNEFPALAPAGAGGPRVLKAHEGHPVCAEWLAAGTAKCLYSYRDMRDVAFSLAHKQGATLRATADRGLLRLCRHNHEFWTAQPNTFVQKYEEWLTDPVPFVRGIAAHLGVGLGPGEAEDIAARYSLEANRRRTEAFAEGLRRQGTDLGDPRNATLSDPDTQLHWNHIRAGAVGGWRDQATPDDIPVLAAECGGWLAENGYDPDPLWPVVARAARRAEEAEVMLEGARAHITRLTDAHAEAARLGAGYAAAHADATRYAVQFEAALKDTARALDASNRDAAALRADNEELRRANAALRATLEGGLACLPYRVARGLKRTLRRAAG
jgi:hypothetical protein